MDMNSSIVVCIGTVVQLQSFAASCTVIQVNTCEAAGCGADRRACGGRGCRAASPPALRPSLFIQIHILTSYISNYTYIYIHLFIYIHISIYIYIYIHVYIYIYDILMYIYIYMYVCIHLCKYVYVQIYIHIDIFIYICMSLLSL